MTIDCVTVPSPLEGSPERDPVGYLRVALQYYNTEAETIWLVESIRTAVDDMREEHDWITLDLTQSMLSDAESDKSGFGRMGSLDSSFSSVCLDAAPAAATAAGDVAAPDDEAECARAVFEEECRAGLLLVDGEPGADREPVASAADLSLGGPVGARSGSAGPSPSLSATLVPLCAVSPRAPSPSIDLRPSPAPPAASCNAEGLMAVLSHDINAVAVAMAVAARPDSTRSAGSERSFGSVGFGSSSDADDENSRPASAGSGFSDMGINAAIEYDSLVEDFDGEFEFDSNRTSYQNPLFEGTEAGLTDDGLTDDEDGDRPLDNEVAGSSGESTVASSLLSLSASSPQTVGPASFTGSMCRHGSTSMRFSSSRGLHEVLGDASDNKDKQSRVAVMSSPGFIIGSPKPNATARSISPMLRAAAISVPSQPRWKPHPYSRIPVSQDMPIHNFSSFSPYSPFSPVIANSRQRPLPLTPQAPPLPLPTSRLTMEDLRSSTPPPMSSRRYGGLSSDTKGQFGSASSLDSGIGIARSL